QVGQNLLRVALAGVPEPAAAAARSPDHVAPPEHDARRLEDVPLVLAPGVDDNVGRGRRGPSEEPPRRRLRPFPPQRHVRLVALDLELAHDAVASTPLAGAAGV